MRLTCHRVQLRISARELHLSITQCNTEELSGLLQVSGQFAQPSSARKTHLLRSYRQLYLEALRDII
jgi:hypothetical protein